MNTREHGFSSQDYRLRQWRSELNAGFTSEPPYFIGGSKLLLRSAFLNLPASLLAHFGRHLTPTWRRQASISDSWWREAN
jgi:hypothetical protein